MAKLLLPPSPHLSPHNVAAFLSRSYSPHPFHPSTSHSTLPPRLFRRFCAARDDPATAAPAPATATPAMEASEPGEDNGSPAAGSPEAKEEYPIGEFVFREISGWRGFLVKLRLLFALPWERVRKGSVLSMKLRGQISDKLQSRFSPGLSLPQICENFTKAAHDPRVVGIYLQIESLNCGWGKVDEIRRSILNFKQSGKFIVGYMPICGEKEYYIGCACGELFAPPSAYVSMYGLTVQASFLGGVLEKVGVEPQIQRIGKYKSAGDQLSRKTISKENFDMLSRILDNIYVNWLGVISSSKGRSSKDIENLINEGIYKAERLKDEGFLTDLKYDDEVVSMLQKRLGQEDKTLRIVDYRKYAKVRKWSLGLAGGKDIIAIIRASGSISRIRGPLSIRSSGVIGEQFIEKIRSIRESNKYKAVIIRIDSPGGDALASDLMWREIRLLANSIPVVASMSDVAASGGYYMAMAAGVIVAENLTLTGSIGVVTDGTSSLALRGPSVGQVLEMSGKFNLKALYERIGFNKETISRGRFAELLAAEQRPFRPDEAELFAKSAQNAYKSFRDKAALSRSMPVEQMEEVAQGRVWTGNDAVSVGLVDAVGGMSRAIAIAKQRANIPQEQQVTLVEVSKHSPTLPEIISGIGSSLLGVDKAVNELLQDIPLYDGVQARMDGILYERLEEGIFGNPILSLVKDYLGSL